MRQRIYQNDDFSPYFRRIAGTIDSCAQKKLHLQAREC